MKLHRNARTCPKSRRLLVDGLEGDWSLTQAAEAAGVSERTACKWLDRYRAEGEESLQDRSSAPHAMPNRIPDARVEAIAALRRLRMTGPEIAEALEMASSTVSAVLGRIGLGKLNRLKPTEPPNRFERAHPGELIHIDVKKLVRIQRGAGHRVTGKRTSQPDLRQPPRDRRERHAKDLDDLRRRHPQLAQRLDRLQAIGRQPRRNRPAWGPLGEPTAKGQPKTLGHVRNP